MKQTSKSHAPHEGSKSAQKRHPRRRRFRRINHTQPLRGNTRGRRGPGLYHSSFDGTWHSVQATGIWTVPETNAAGSTTFTCQICPASFEWMKEQSYLWEWWKPVAIRFDIVPLENLLTCSGEYISVIDYDSMDDIDYTPSRLASFSGVTVCPARTGTSVTYLPKGNLGLKKFRTADNPSSSDWEEAGQFILSAIGMPANAPTFTIRWSATFAFSVAQIVPRAIRQDMALGANPSGGGPFGQTVGVSATQRATDIIRVPLEEIAGAALGADMAGSPTTAGVAPITVYDAPAAMRILAPGVYRLITRLFARFARGTPGSVLPASALRDLISADSGGSGNDWGGLTGWLVGDKTTAAQPIHLLPTTKAQKKMETVIDKADNYTYYEQEWLACLLPGQHVIPYWHANIGYGAAAPWVDATTKLVLSFLPQSQMLLPSALGTNAYFGGYNVSIEAVTGNPNISPPNVWCDQIIVPPIKYLSHGMNLTSEARTALIGVTSGGGCSSSAAPLPRALPSTPPPPLPAAPPPPTTIPFRAASPSSSSSPPAAAASTITAQATPSMPSLPVADMADSISMSPAEIAALRAAEEERMRRRAQRESSASRQAANTAGVRP